MSIIQIFFFIAAILAGFLVVFQILLAIGLPFGKLAWGGEYNKLPKKLRISSFISSLLLAYALIILLESADLINVIGNKTIVSISKWMFLIIFGLSTLGNITSKSRQEKMVMTPIALFLVFAFLIAIIG